MYSFYYLCIVWLGCFNEIMGRQQIGFSR